MSFPLGYTYESWKRLAVQRGWKVPHNDALHPLSWINYWVAMDEYERKVAAGDPDPGRPVVPHRSAAAPAAAAVIKVFRINDCDWYAGADLESCVQNSMKETGMHREEAVDEDARELTDAEMGKLIFVEEDGTKRTFKAQLQNLIEAGCSFPCFFATTEY